MQKKKLLIIGSLPPPYYGCTVAIQGLLDSRLKEEFNLIHLDTSDHRGFGNLGKFDFINIWLGLKNIIQLVYISIFRKPDLVYIIPGTNIGSCLREGLFVIVIKMFSCAKVVAHFRTSYFKSFFDQCNWLFKKFIDFFLRKVDHAIVLGECFRPMISRWFELDKIDVVPNGTSFDPFRGKEIDKSFDRNSPVQITYMSNIDPGKGILVLIKALMRIIHCTKQPFSLMIAGAWSFNESSFKAQVKDLIEKGGLHNVVHFIGVVKGETKEKLLKQTDIFVLPSFYEAHPFSIIEAMAAACPVISTWRGAIPETVLDGETGILVEKGDVESLANALVKLIEDPKIRKNMGLAGRKRYEKYYTKENNIENMICVFRKILLT